MIGRGQQQLKTKKNISRCCLSGLKTYNLSDLSGHTRNMKLGLLVRLSRYTNPLPRQDANHMQVTTEQRRPTFISCFSLTYTSPEGFGRY